jgi:hypothetical protein
MLEFQIRPYYPDDKLQVVDIIHDELGHLFKDDEKFMEPTISSLGNENVFVAFIGTNILGFISYLPLEFGLGLENHYKKYWFTHSTGMTELEFIKSHPEYSEPCMYVENLAVRLDAQRQGIALALKERVIIESLTQGKKYLYSHSWSGGNSINLAKKMAAIPLGRVSEFYPNGESAVVMQIDVQGYEFRHPMFKS